MWSNQRSLGIHGELVAVNAQHHEHKCRPTGSVEFHRAELNPPDLRLSCNCKRSEPFGKATIQWFWRLLPTTGRRDPHCWSTNTNCVPRYVAGVPVPSTAANSSSTSRVPAATGSPSSAQSGHSHAGAIAGGVVGGVALLATVFAVIIFCFLRRRPSRSRRGYEDGGGRRWSFRKLRSGNNTTRSSVQKPSPNLQAEQTIIGSDEEISTVGHEKLVAVAQASHPPQQPTRTQSLRTSAQMTASYRDGRATANPERPGSRASYGAHPGEAIPLEHTHLQYSPSLSVTSPRRKPAPRYDGAAEAEEREGRSSSQSTLDPIHGDSAKGSPDSVHILQHKSSFGAVRPMRVMITDPPTCAPP